MNVDVSPDGRAGRLRSARRHLHDADRRHRDVARRRGSRAARRSTCSRASARTASASRSRAIATASGTSGRWTRTGRTRSRSRASSAGSSTARPGRPTAATSSRAGTSWRTRSLGAGEIWMFHAARIRRPAGHREERLPEGRRRAGDLARRHATSITARTSRPGQTFEYNKDPERHDLRDHPARSDDRPRAAGGVGAGRLRHAAPSARRQVARVRPPRAPRAASCSSAISTTGRDRPIFDHLDKDLQEAWAIHGLYPQYAWTPDGKAIVIWGEGKIWRVDVATGDGDAGPVHRARRADDERGASASRRRSTRREFQVKALRDVAVSPDGKRVAYSALGHIYVKDLPERRAEARDEATTRSSSRRRGRPTASGSSTRRGPTPTTAASASCAPTAPAGRDVVTTPGHYTEPSFSPDGKWIVFRNAGADGTRGPLYGGNTGIYVVPADGSSRAAARARRRHRSRRSITPASASSSTTSASGKAVLVSVGIGDPDSPLLGRRRDRPLPVRQRHADRAVARRQVGRVRRAVARLRRAVPAHGPPDRSRPDDGGLSRRRASRATRASTCTGRATADRSTGRWARSSSRAISRRRSRSSTPASRSPTSPRRRASPIGFSRPSDAPAGVDRARRRAASSPMARQRRAPSVDRERHDRRRGQPHHRDRAGRRGRDPGRRAAASTSRGKTIMPGIIDVHAPRRRRGRRHPRAGELAARWPTSPSA